MTNNIEIQVKNSLIYLLPKILTGFLPLITLPIFTRVLTRNDYGVYALAEVYAILLSGIVNFGLTASYERNFFQYKDKKKSAQLLYSTLAFVLAAFSAAIVFTQIFSKPIAKVFIGSREYSLLLFWVFLATVIVSFKQYYLIYFKNTENARKFVVYTLDETLLGVIFSLFFVVYLKVGVIGLAWGQCLASIVILSALTLRFLKILPLCFGWGVLKDSFKISIPLTPRIFMGVLSTQLNKYILNLLNTVGGVGVFSIGQKIANVTFIFMTTIQNVFNPQVYKKMFSGESNAGEEIGAYLTPFVYFSISVCLLVSLFAEEAVRILTGPSFYVAAPVISIFSLYYGFQFFGKINGTQLIYKKKTFLTSILTIMDICVGVSISIPFIIKFGVVGAAWGTFLGSIITVIVSSFVSQHYYRIQWEAKKLISIFGVFCVSTLFILLVMNGSVDYAARFCLKLLFVAVYAYLGVKLHIITRQNLKILWNVLTFKKSAVAVNIDVAG